MKGYFREFQKKEGQGPAVSTGIAALSGTIYSFDEEEETITVKTTAYDSKRREEVTSKHEINLSEVGGFDKDAYPKGADVTVIGTLNNENQLVAKDINCGDCVLEYEGYGIASGTFKYKENQKDQFHKEKPIEASMRTNSIPGYDSVKVVFDIASYNAKDVDMDHQNSDAQNNAKRFLNGVAAHYGADKIKQKYMQDAYESVPFKSVFTYKANKSLNKNGVPFDQVTEFTPSEGHFAGTTFYTKHPLGSYTISSGYSFGDVDVEALKETFKFRNVEFTEPAEEKTEKAQTKTAPTEKEAPVTEVPAKAESPKTEEKASAGEPRFEEDEIDYEEN